MSNSFRVPDVPFDASGRTRLSTLISVGAVFAALGSIGYVSLNKPVVEDAYLSPVNGVSGVLATLGLMVLTFGLLRWRTELPNWAIVVSASGLWFAGWQALDAVTTLPAMVSLDAVDTKVFREDAFTWYVLAGMAAKSVASLIGFVALGIAGIRKRCIPLAASIILILAGLVSIFPPYPPGLTLFSIAVFIVGRGPMATRT